MSARAKCGEQSKVEKLVKLNEEEEEERLLWHNVRTASDWR